MTKARKARLEEARSWLAENSFSDDAHIVKAYRTRFQVDRRCAMAELCLLHVLSPEKQKAYEAELDRKKAKEAAKANAQALIDDSDSDETFAYIAGYTSWDIPYGVTWDELENHPESPEDIAPFAE
ncbi:MAG: hypothetical protein IJ188_02140 [Clostridia bacterium]|nr:hypothetical protein [Clostridia bacterium]